jgi:hypothetical protein
MEKKTFDALSKRLRTLFPIDEVITTSVQAALLRLMLNELQPQTSAPKQKERA